MKIVIPGGSGQLGQILRADFERTRDRVVILSRSPRAGSGEVYWDGRTTGAWTQEVDGADVVINLAGRTVNCRYTEENLAQMMDSRVDSTRAVGRAIAMSIRPPALWLQMSTATIYAHRLDAPNDEQTGIIGGAEVGVPTYWARSVHIAEAWERELEKAETPQTRKVAMRTAMVMAPGKGGVFQVLYNMTRAGLGGSIGGGTQFVSWIHCEDFCRAVRFAIEQKSIAGAVNFTSANPLPQSEFMRSLRRALHMPIGLPAAKWMAEIGAFVLRTDTELLLKSRRVIPGRLLKEGFQFRFPEWPAAAADLAAAARGK